MSDTHIVDGVEYHSAYLISSKHLQIMEGKLLTLVELLGLGATQEEAFKSELRQRIWGGTALKHGTLIFAHEMPALLCHISDIEEKRKAVREADSTDGFIGPLGRVGAR